MYDWRKMSAIEREDAFVARINKAFPWHSPPHFDSDKTKWYILSGSCYEHKCHIGYSFERMSDFCFDLLNICEDGSECIRSWCVLPNHYHVLLRTGGMKELRKAIGRLHGRTSRCWNKQEKKIGRRVWFNCLERSMRCNYHFWSSVNYIHNNPVKHGFVSKWIDWPFSSAKEYVETIGREKAVRIWQKYSISGYGQEWDSDL